MFPYRLNIYWKRRWRIRGRQPYAVASRYDWWAQIGPVLIFHVRRVET